MDDIQLNPGYHMPLESMAFWWVTGAIAIGIAVYIFRRRGNP